MYLYIHIYSYISGVLSLYSDSVSGQCRSVVGPQVDQQHAFQCVFLFYIFRPSIERDVHKERFNWQHFSGYTGCALFPSFYYSNLIISGIIYDDDDDDEIQQTLAKKHVFFFLIFSLLRLSTPFPHRIGFREVSTGAEGAGLCGEWSFLRVRGPGLRHQSGASAPGG